MAGRGASSCGHGAPRGMTLTEVMVSTSIFAVVLFVAYGALQSMRSFAQTNTTQVELQEEARHAVEFMMGRLSYKVPSYIEFRDMLPKSKVGKLLRREIRDEERRKLGGN